MQSMPAEMSFALAQQSAPSLPPSNGRVAVAPAQRESLGNRLFRVHGVELLLYICPGQQLIAISVSVIVDDAREDVGQIRILGRAGLAPAFIIRRPYSGKYRRYATGRLAWRLAIDSAPRPDNCLTCRVDHNTAVPLGRTISRTSAKTYSSDQRTSPTKCSSD